MAIFGSPPAAPRVWGFPFLNYLAVLVVALGFSAFELTTSYHETRQHAESSLGALALAIDASFGANLKAADFVLSQMVARSDRLILRAVDARPHGVARDPWLSDMARAVPIATSIDYFDARGHRLYTSLDDLTPATISDRAYFDIPRTGRDAGSTVYSDVLISRVSHRPVMVAARAIRAREGTFLGVAMVRLDLGAIQNLLAGLHPSGVAAIRRLDNGALVVRYPGTVTIDNTPFPDLPPRQAILAGRHSGTLSITSAVDGVDRLYAFRRIGDFPFLTTVGSDHERYLEEWWRKLVLYLVAAALLAGLLVLLERTRRQRLRQLEESERRLRTILDALPVAAALNDDAGNILYANPALSHLLGYTLAEIPTLGDWFPKAYPDPDYRAWVTAEWGRRLTACREQRTPFEPLEVRVRKADGGQLTMLATADDLAGDGRGLHLVTLIDITTQKQQEEAIATQRRRLDDILTGTHVGTWEWNVQTGETTFNARWADIVGYTLDELAPTSIDTWTRLAHPDDLPRSGERLQQHFSGELPYYECEARMRHKDGHWVWVLDRGKVASWTTDGKPLLMSGTHQDISARKAMEAELIAHRDHLEHLVDQRTADLEVAREAAESASRAKTAFLSAVSHELRTPMHAVLGMMEMAAATTAEAKARDYLAKGERAAHLLLGLINDMLDISRIESSRLTLASTLFTTDEILAAVLVEMAPIADAKGLGLEHAMEPGLGSRRWRGDPTRLTQVLTHLAANAVKFTEQGHIAIAIRLLPADGSQRLRFEVVDTGIGIAPADQARLFRIFEQIDGSHARRHGGTGLGLALCKRLVEAMGGSIEVRSQPGHGSTFWFDIPARENLPDAADADPASAAAALGTEHAGAAVLVVDADSTHRETTARLLEQAGLNVFTANDGVEAVNMARAGSFALILIDIDLPGQAGIDATYEIRAIPAHARTPIMAMTAREFAEQRDTCARAGMNDHLDKKAGGETLYPAVLRWLRIRHAAASQNQPHPSPPSVPVR